MKPLISPFLFLSGLLLACLGHPIGLMLIAAALLLVVADQTRTGALLYAFPSNCEGRIINVSSSAGCTLTRASIQGMTPNDFEAQGFKEIGMDKVYANLREARVAGYRESTLQMLLMSRISNIKSSLTKTKIPPSESVILPYVSRRQRRNINSNYWSITAGAPTPGAGTGDIPTAAWDLTVTNNPSPLANTLQNLDKYFLPGKYLFVEYSDATTSVAYSNAYKIIAAATVAGVTKVTVTPNYTRDGWNALTAPQKLVFQIGGVNGGNAAAGTIGYLGANSVSDFESWKGQDVAENTNSLIHFWLQTSRLVFEYNDQYLEALDAALTSNYFKLFRQLPLAEQKRIQQAKFDRDMMNSAFYGQQISEKQNVETYNQLDQVVDPANPNCVLEYKANALGFKTLLSNCGRVLDHQGNPLNLDSLFNTLYYIARAREADGTQVEVIDIGTDKDTSGMILDIMVQYYKAKHGVNYTRFYQPDQALKFNDEVMLKYNLYQLPPEFGGYSFAVYTDRFWDDKLAAMGGANRGRTLWILDWSDIELGVAATNSRMTMTNIADQLYNYVIKPNIKHVSLNSMTWSAIIEDPNRHYIVENFSNACPKLTVAGCNVSTPT